MNKSNTSIAQTDHCSLNTADTTDRNVFAEFSVSVIIPVFNAERHLRHAVESALRQQEVGEIILVEDGSTDNSLSVARSLVEDHPERVRLFWHNGHANKGPGASRNVGLREARCPFIAFLDADDWYMPDCFAADRQAFEDDPELDMVRHSLGNACNPDDEEQQWFLSYSREARERFCSIVEGVSPENYFEALYPMGTLTAGVAGIMTIRRELASAVGGFPDRYWAEDITFHLKIASMGRIHFANMEQPMAMRRIHANNLSRTHVDNMAVRLDYLAMALLDVMSFLKDRELAFRYKKALHKAWVRIGWRLTSMRSFALIAAAPETIRSPYVLWLYFKFYINLVLKHCLRHLLALRLRCLYLWRSIWDKFDAKIMGPFLPVFMWERRDGIKKKNWGDDINRHLLAAITGKRVKAIIGAAMQVTPHYTAIGSVLSFANSKSIVWGTGAIAEDKIPSRVPARICAVRGPLTRKALEKAGIACPEVYGDPALLLRHFYSPKKQSHGKVVIVPHYIDIECPMVNRIVEQEQAILLRPDKYDFWLDFVDTIAGASRVYASSLHALIVAEAYDVPSVWVRFSDDIYGGNFKFQDFYQSIGKSNLNPVLINKESDLKYLKEAAGKWTPGNINLDPLIRACPFPLLKKPFTRSKAKKQGRFNG